MEKMIEMENTDNPKNNYNKMLQNNFKKEMKSKMKDKPFELVFMISAFLFLLVVPQYLVNKYGVTSHEVYLFWVTIYVLFLLTHVLSYLFCMMTLLVVYFRTKYHSYLIEFLVFLVSILIPIIGLFFIPIGPNVVIYIFIMLLIMSAGPLVGQKLVSKPIIIYNLKYQSNYSKTDILLKKTVNLQEFEDGFSLRPIFIPISHLDFGFESLSDFRLRIRDYARFLLKHGELLNYKEDDQIINFYLRTSISTSGRWFFNAWYYFKKFRAIYKNEDLTTITILFKQKRNPELSMKVIDDNYNKLQDVTYHLLVEGILKDFKYSMIAFFNSDYSQALFKMNPYPKSH